MSGIVGLVNLDGAPVDRAALCRMLGAVAHRGPDARNLVDWASGGLGHALLRATPESKQEQQPLDDGNGTWLVADIRLDNRDELSAELELAQGLPDPDFLLAAYLKWGADFVRRLLGDFAIAVWDARSQRLLLVRDHVGVKPLYFTRNGQCVAFASDVRGLLPLLPHPPPLDELAMGDFLLFGRNLHADRTVYSGIQPVWAAHVLSADRDEVRQRQYWRLEDQPAEQPRNEVETVEGFSQLLRTAIRDRLRSNSPVATLMSGGLDSTAVTGLADDILASWGVPTPRLHTFTVGIDAVSTDRERDFAAEVMDQRSLAGHFIAADRFLPLAPCCDSLRPPPQPHSWLGRSCLIRAIYSDLGNGGIRTSLDGEGGDLILSPEPAFFASLLWHGRWTQALRLAWDYRRRSGSWPPPYLRSALMGRWRKRQHRQSVEATFPIGLRDSFVRRANLRERWREIEAAPKLKVSEHTVRPLYRQLVEQTFWQSVFEAKDPANFGVPAEARSPFMDVRLLAFADRLVPVPWCVDKHLLRESLRGVLPNAVRVRAKSPYGRPAGLPSPDPARTEDLLENAVLEQLGYVDTCELRRCLSQHAHRGPTRQTNQMIQILEVEDWLRSA